MEYLSLVERLIQQISFVDIVLTIILLFYAFEGFSMGFIISLLDSFSFLIALILSFMGYKYVADWFVIAKMTKIIAAPTAFISILLVVDGGLHLLRHAFGIPLTKLQFVIPSSFRFVNHLLGLIFGVFTGSILLMSIVSALAVLPLNNAFKSSLHTSMFAQFYLQNAQNLEGTYSSLIGKTPTDLLTFFTIAPSDQSTIQLGFTVPNPSDNQEEAQQMFIAVNEQRQQQNVPSLTWDDMLAQVGQSHGEDMLVRGYFSHNTPEGKTPFDRMTDAGIIYTDAGENLALSQSVDLAMQGFMNSPGHRANILSEKFHKIGISVLHAGFSGEVFVQEFTN